MASDSESTMITMEGIIATLKAFDSAELFKLIKAATTEAEKKSKRGGSGDASVSRKKSGSMPKGAVPPQLKKPRAWVEFTLRHALENGWESFTVLQKKKLRGEGGQDVSLEEQIEMPASVLHNGAYIYEDSITEKTPSGRQIIHKEAMSLSKQRKEAGHPTYAEFEASYVEETTDDEKSVTSSTSSHHLSGDQARGASAKKIVIKKTVAEKEAETAAKKAAKEAEKAAAKAEKEAEKEAKKAEKEAEKAAKKAEKEQEKKVSKKPVATKAVVPVAALKKPTSVQSSPAGAASLVPVAPPPTPVAPKKKPSPKEEIQPPKAASSNSAKQSEIPNDGMVHPWTYKGKKYLRNSDGEMWAAEADGSIGKWVGVYDAKADKIDTTAEEPVFDDEE